MQSHISREDWDLVGGKCAVLMAGTTPQDPYYGEFFHQIADFQAGLAKAILQNDRDHCLLLVDPSVVNEFRSRGLPASCLAEFPLALDDIWIRDFAPVGLVRHAWFKYQPSYLKKSESGRVQKQFRQFIQSNSHLFGDLSNSASTPADVTIRLDGGNVVDNQPFAASDSAAGSPDSVAVVTQRVRRDNRQLTKDRLNSALRSQLGCKRLVLLSEAEGDTTGHSDGLVAFLDQSRLAVACSGNAAAEERLLVQELTKQLAGSAVEIVRLEASPAVEQTWRGYPSACGLHVNLLATRNCLYVPVFGADESNRKLGQSTELDARVLGTMRANTTKMVVPVDVPNVICRMGGGVRCLTWAFGHAL